jgi:hypothetical protein
VKQIRQRLTYANVMSSIAVFLILGGATAFAATKIGANEIKANSIKTGKIVKEAVTAGKIKNSAITNSKIADNAVTTTKIADNAVTTTKIADNAVTGTKIVDNAVTGTKIANGAVSAGKLAADAQPTPVAAFQVNGSNGALLGATPGVVVLRIGTGAYCVGVPFVAKGGAVSTRGDTAAGTTAQTTVPADGNCSTHPGFQSASVYTINSAGSLSDQNWSGIYR